MKKMMFLLILFYPACLQAQFLKAGFKVVYPAVVNLNTPQDRTFYFADDINSEYRLSPEKSLQRRFIVFPKFFVHYMLNDNWFVTYEAGYLSLLKAYTIRSFTDFKNNNVLDTHYEYSFVTQSLNVGYKFLRTREVRPRIHGGLALTSLLRLREVSSRSDAFKLANITPYGQVMHQHIHALKDNFTSYAVGIGLDYYILNVDLSVEHSLGSIEREQFFPLYTSYQAIFFSVGVNLLGVLPKSGKVKSYKTRPE